jgi:hypothetical protein
VEYEPGAALRLKKKQRDRLIRLCDEHGDWVLGFMEEVWWRRLAPPRIKSWAEGNPLRVLEKERGKTDTEPKAVGC